MSTDQNKEKPLEIAADQLSEEALNSLIESYILREGTDYGLHEVILEKKMLQVRRLIDKNEVKIVFDQTTETVSLITAQDFRRLT